MSNTFMGVLSQELWSTWTAISLLLVACQIWAVLELWRGMRLDSFQRQLRNVQREPATRFAFRQPSSVRFGFRACFKLSLFSTLTCSAMAAVLIAQAIRPDETSRLFTWLLFVTIAGWRGAYVWAGFRGLGPLRNHAFAGAVSSSLMSTALWLFYLAVDRLRGDVSYEVVTIESSSMLLWWSFLGACWGCALGSYVAERVYRAPIAGSPDNWTRVENEAVGAGAVNLDSANVEYPRISHRSEQVRLDSTWDRPFQPSNWRPAVLGIVASLLFHVTIPPNVYQAVFGRFEAATWLRDDSQDPWPRRLGESRRIVLTMEPRSHAVTDAFQVATRPSASAAAHASRSLDGVALSETQDGGFYLRAKRRLPAGTLVQREDFVLVKADLSFNKSSSANLDGVRFSDWDDPHFGQSAALVMRVPLEPGRLLQLGSFEARAVEDVSEGLDETRIGDDELAIPPVLYSDEPPWVAIVTADGRILEGKLILQRGDEIHLATPQKVLILKADDVENINYLKRPLLASPNPPAAN